LWLGHGRGDGDRKRERERGKEEVLAKLTTNLSLQEPAGGKKRREGGKAVQGVCNWQDIDKVILLYYRRKRRRGEKRTEAANGPRVLVPLLF